MIKWTLFFVLLVSGLITVATGASIILDIYGFAARFGIDLHKGTNGFGSKIPKRTTL